VLDLAEQIRLLNENRGRYASVYPGYITHIRFPRYKNIADGARVDFEFPVTALVGANGSGKTSVLNALYGAPARRSTGHYWFSTKVDPIEEGDGSPSRFIYGHYHRQFRAVVETRKARVKKARHGRLDPNYWEPTKELASDGMEEPRLRAGTNYLGRSKDRWNPVKRDVLYINFRKELSAFDKYFYFGKDPASRRSASSAVKETAREAIKTGRNGKLLSGRKIMSKMDQVRNDAELLARVIASNDTSCTYFNRPIATENRLLTTEELGIVSFILGREYEEARWVRHRLFKGDGGLSIVFKTKHGKYSEAFAGSGEVAVTSCVVQILTANPGTLILLDEPEVSLHPGAQERLLAFLTQRARTRQLQIVFSTHSPHLVASLPDDAIKTFHLLDDGRFAIVPSTHPYAAFIKLGAVGGGNIRVIVEDRLAKDVVTQALLALDDPAQREIFSVEFVSGGADAILTYQVPVILDAPGHTLVLLDGDKRRVDEFIDPDTIPVAEDGSLATRIREATGVEPKFTVDGGIGGGNALQFIQLRRKYLGWIKDNVKFIPTNCPEELVLRAGEKVDANSTTSQHHKDRLRSLAVELFGPDVSNEETDRYGATLLANNRANSLELMELVNILRRYLTAQRP